ncbi:DNA/RNA polymerase [Xylona heveae TC161]|uniref:DNA-directed RNA polymerase, mitochondrial n=1 Tax=Xylona heveae (strain CBS 132557 / TC161) TaxID=1328760 RepID=A0A161TBT4_XYLHT|nr:DNA/RNA polymerase [Xylona heveae TC161]KZF23167.1 DNA/RNA polymerase [Xylona heveae TC161]
MLVRAARRKAQYDAFRHLRLSPEPLYLPWLCPAQLRYISQLRTTSPLSLETPRSKLAKKRRLSTDTAERRNLATAVSEQTHFADPAVPFEFEDFSGPYVSQSKLQASFFDSENLSTLRNFDPSSPLIVNDESSLAAKRFKVKDGIGGGLADMHLTLDACLKCGSFDRGTALMRRICKIYVSGSQELLDAHNQYLEACIDYAIRKRDMDALKAVQKWFEVEMRSPDVEPDATSYALMLKATLRLLQGPKMERTVRRYYYMAEERNLGVAALSTNILNDAELFKVTRICPEDFYLAEEVVTEPEDVSTATLDGSGQPQTIPEVKPMGQKGLGLASLKKSLSLFSDISTLPKLEDLKGTTEEKAKAFAYLRQEKLEEDAVNAAIDRWREESEDLQKFGLNSALQSRSIGALMWEWHSALTPLIKEEVKLIDEAEKNNSKSEVDQDRCLYGPFLRFVSPEKLAAITILAVMQLLSIRGADIGVKLSNVVVYIGHNVQDESIAESIKDYGNKELWGHMATAGREQKVASLLRKKRTFDSLAKLVREKEQKPLGSKDFQDRQWSAAVKARVGAILLSALLRSAKIQVTRKLPDTRETVSQMQAAFTHSYKYDRGKRVGMISGNSDLCEKLRREPVRTALAKHLPMIVEPRPWKSFNDGGFLRYPVNAVRVKHSDPEQIQYAKAAAEKGDMDQVFAGLDVLAKTAWKINRDVFNVMLEAWNSGEAIADIAPEHPNIKTPPEPEPSADPKVRQRWLRDLKQVQNTRSGLHSQRCFQNFQLEVARAYLDETFYFPHNVDFRGRAYPVPPYLNHMGADNCRGLLMFAKGKQLGATGLAWLKVHLANVYGFDKASIKERQEFAMQHLSDIYDSATNPLNGKRWWLGAEDPWQCLAACCELKKALDSSDPTRYVSSLAIHQDGTCNGLQHYAALGGDEWGARQVNLEPGDRPADIYTAVAELVKEEVSRDAAKKVPVAMLLNGKITRKVVKQTVMTNVYGVTFAGARSQVRRQLEAILPHFPDTDEMNHGISSCYVARLIFKALSSMFKGAHDIQYWLGECANRISQALTPEQIEIIEASKAGSKSALPKSNQPHFRSSVVWTTPLKMPVVQPYRTSKAQIVSTNLQRVSIIQPTTSDPVSKRKQLQGFPPNFIHSLDATHMLLSALKCDERGLSFAAVHDSFWTHAADVDTMNSILRDAFIRMHSEDIIGRLAAEFKARHAGSMYLASVYSDSLVGKRITALRRQTAFSSKGRSRVDELLLERQRILLLQSEDPKSQEEGRKMVTPGSIFAEAASENDLAPAEETTEMGIGDVPKAQVKAAEQDIGIDAVENLENVEPVLGGAESSLALDDVDAEDENDVKLEPAPKKRKAAPKKVSVWLPLSFPPLPKKGSFEVSRLRDSKYFFS